jgi:hypothetical protein
MATIVSARMPEELVAALNAWAIRHRTSRSAVLRALVEDAVDAGEPPDAPAPAVTVDDIVEELRDEELERLRELAG